VLLFSFQVVQRRELDLLQERDYEFERQREGRDNMGPFVDRESHMLLRLVVELALLLLVVGDGALDGILGEHAAVQLHGREGEMLRDLRVLDHLGLVKALALDPLSGERAACDGRSAAKRLEHGVNDLAVLDLDLKLHHIATSRSANEAGSHMGRFLIERAHIPRIFVVLDHALMVEPLGSSCCRTHSGGIQKGRVEGGGVDGRTSEGAIHLLRNERNGPKPFFI